jgi:hypothetical protein
MDFLGYRFWENIIGEDFYFPETSPFFLLGFSVWFSGGVSVIGNILFREITFFVFCKRGQ